MRTRVAEHQSFRAVIFDMDGVLIDSELHWKAVEGYFLKSLVPGWTAEDQTRIIGLSLHNVHAMLVKEYGMQASAEEFFRQYHGMAREIYMERISLIEPFPQLLETLSEGEVPVALASSSPRPWIEMMLSRFSLHSRFRVVVSADELEGKGKPAPDIYLLTARRLEVEPAECIVIEDSRNGAVSAKAAGMYCIGFRNGFNDEQELSAADVVLDSAQEISEKVLALLADTGSHQ
jgi:HAD superfamily hydrolase (TIGR01509 family)